MGQTRLFQPHQSREETCANEGGQRHVGGRQAGMRQDGRQEGKQEDRHHGNQISEVLPAPRINHQGRDPEERKDSQAGQRQVAIIVVVAVEDERAFLVHVGGSRRPAARQVRSQGGGYARQRRMLRLVMVDALVQPLHSAGDVRRLIDSMVENRVGCHDAQGSQRNEDEKRQNGVPLKPGNDRTERRRLGYRGDLFFLLFGHVKDQYRRDAQRRARQARKVIR